MNPSGCRTSEFQLSRWLAHGTRHKGQGTTTCPGSCPRSIAHLCLLYPVQLYSLCTPVHSTGHRTPATAGSLWELPSLEPHLAAAIVAPRPSSARRQRTLPSNLTRRGPLASFARESNADPSQPANQEERGHRNKPFPPRTTLSNLSTPRELLCTLYHASSRPHSSKAESRLALSANDPAGQCERPSPVSACSLRVLSHPLCRFRQHFAASSTTHLLGSPMSTAALQVTKPIAA